MTSGAASSVFIDTNVLVYATLAHSPLQQAAQQAIQTQAQAGTTLWISRQIIREYLAVLTRPQTFSLPVPIATLINEITSFESQYQIAEDGPQVTKGLLNLITQIPTGGKQIHDANIVATMLSHSVTQILTHNIGDFNRYSSLIIVIPL